MADTPKSEGASKGDDKLIEEARARFKIAMDAERDNRRLAAEDRKFRSGDQWPAEVRAAREAAGRPCLTINKMPQFEQQVTNDQRQNRPSIKVHPVDDVADPETAKVFQGIIKHIEVASSSDTARDTGFEGAVRGGYGYYRIVTEYADPSGFELEIRVKRIRDPDTVLLDPNHQEPDGSDAEFGFVFERVPKDKYRRDYGESELAKASDADWDLEISQTEGWVEEDTVLVAEYFYKHYETKSLALLSDGQIMEKDEAEKFVAASVVQAVDEMGQPMGEPQPSVKIAKERSARIPSVKWCKINGREVLDKTDWPGQWIPILPVYGAELVVDGKLIRESLIRHAKDPARMYNFWKSAETEAITLAPKAPFIADAKQIEGYENIWAGANRENHSYLPYNAIIGNTVLPPPQRSSSDVSTQAITQASMFAADEVKSTIGIYDASLGNKSNETSGIAIQRRNQQAQTSNFHFTDNLNRTIRHEARILVDLIPKIYDSPRIARIIGEDGEQKIVKINQPTGEMGKDGKPLVHKLDVGKYDVTVDTGPSYATRRQEAASTMMEFSKAVPQAAAVTADLIAGSMDWPGAKEFSERLKKTLPPGMLDDDKNNQQIPPQVQAQMQQMNQMVEQLTAKLNEAQHSLETKREELESRERIEMAKLETQATIELAKLESKEAITLLENQIQSANTAMDALRRQTAELDARTKMLDFNEPMAVERPQSFAEEDAGAMGAMGVDPGMNPTGGESPGPTEQF